MLFQITNTCNMGCPHCLDKATGEPMHMEMSTFDKAVGFALHSRSHVVLVSGGEPSLHPSFTEIMTRCCRTFDVVGLVTNGEWLSDKGKEDALVSLMKRFSSLSIQITSVEEFYRRHRLTLGLADAFVSRLKADGITDRVSVCTGPLHLKALGRAAESVALTERAMKSKGTMSCFSSSLVAAQLPYLKTIESLEARGKFCHPLVDWRGMVHWSESWLCPSFGDVTMDSFEELDAKACFWRPCCRCADYAKLAGNDSGMYLAAKAILGIRNRPIPEATVSEGVSHG